MSDWLIHIPPEIATRAYRAAGEFAWARDDALRVVEALKEKHFIILGVEVWLPTEPGPTIPSPILYVWSLQSVGGTPTYARSATEFIRDFGWADDDEDNEDSEPYFNLTVMEVDA